MTTLSRRHLLRGRWHSASTEPRPPWTVSEAAFIAACHRCHACITDCESGVLIVGQGGFPTLDFTRAECTFCRRCADICPRPLFLDAESEPWQLRAEIAAGCLSLHGIECRSCQDGCEGRAITFVPRLGGVAVIQLNRAHCNGCGACVSACPVGAVQMVQAGSADAVEVKETNEL